MAETPGAQAPQPLVGFLSNQAWDELLAEVNARVQALENLSDPEVKDQVFALLQGVDTIHREALRRLVRLFKQGVLEQVVTDPAIHTLMELYDLLPSTENPPARKTTFPDIPVKVVPAARPPAERPHWLPALSRDELGLGGIETVCLADKEVLLCRTEDDALFALAARCAQDASPLAGATLQGYMLACPNHPGCLYDIRQGTRLASADRIVCYPVKTDADNRVFVGFGIRFQANLPSF